MNAAQQLHRLGQSLWLDNVTRDLLKTQTLDEYMIELALTGLTFNPADYARAIQHSHAYDRAIREGVARGQSGEELFYELAYEDLGRAADLFRPIFDRTNGVDGWVSLEVPPRLACYPVETLKVAKAIYYRVDRRNMMIKIPGTKECLPTIEEAIFSGIPVNITRLFSPEQYLSAAEAFIRGIERRIEAGLNPHVGSVASVCISRWDAAVADKVPEGLKNQLGIAMANRIYRAYRELLTSPRWQRIFNAGARTQRLGWTCTETKDPQASDVLYIKALTAPFTVNTIPEETLIALAKHGEVGTLMAADGGDCDKMLQEFAKAGIQIDNLAAQIREAATNSFMQSWNELLAVVESKSNAMNPAVHGMEFSS